MNIILDIDGTLVSESKNGELALPKQRPYLAEFLETCFSRCKTVSIWSASSEEWVRYIYKEFLQPILKDRKFFFVYTRERCTPVYDIDIEDAKPVSGFEKHLKKVWKKYDGFTKNNTYIVDDTPLSYRKNYGNALPIKTYFEDSKEDEELLILSEKIKQMTS